MDEERIDLNYVDTLKSYRGLAKNERDIKIKIHEDEEIVADLTEAADNLRAKQSSARTAEERDRYTKALNRLGLREQVEALEESRSKLREIEQEKNEIRENAEKYYNQEKTSIDEEILRLENLINNLESIKVPGKVEMAALQNAKDDLEDKKGELSTLNANYDMFLKSVDRCDKRANKIGDINQDIEDKEDEAADNFLRKKHPRYGDRQYGLDEDRDNSEEDRDNSEEDRDDSEEDRDNSEEDRDDSEEDRDNPEEDRDNSEEDRDSSEEDRDNSEEDRDNPDDSSKAIDPKKLPIRTFWEIYNDTHKNHCGTFRRTIYQMAHAPIFGAFGKGKDTVDRVLSVAIDAVTWPVKLVAKATNGILKTDKLYQAEHDAISKLSPEEFDILVSDSAEANMLNGRTVKLSTDRHFLEPNLMKQAKVNDMYLDVVGQVLNERQSQQLNGFDTRDKDGNTVHVRGIEEMITANEQRIRELGQKRQDGSITPEERAELGNLGVSNSQLKAAAKSIADKAIGFREGAKLKTGSFKNISGWVLAKNNPDNREFVGKMAGLSAQLREATLAGDAARIAELDTEMDDLMRQNTKIKQIGFNKNNLLDRGNASLVRQGEFLDKGSQDKTRKLLTTVALGTVVGKAMYTWAVNKGIIAHNSEVEVANQYNGDIKYSGQKTFADQKDINEAATDYASTKVAGGHGVGEYSNLDESAMETDGKWADGLNTPNYTSRDEALHASTNQAMSQIQATADPVQKAIIGSKYYSGIQSHAQSISQQYAPTHQMFDYSGFEQALAGPGNGDAMIKLLTDIGNGTINYSGSVAGMQVGTLDTISYIPDIAAGLAVGRIVLNAASKEAEARAQQALQKQIERNKAKVARKAARKASKDKDNDDKDQNDDR